MSISEELRLKMTVSEHEFKHDLGTTVFLKSDDSNKYPMLIVGYITDDYNCNDYSVTWLNKQGIKQTGEFPAECLIKKVTND